MHNRPRVLVLMVWALIGVGVGVARSAPPNASDVEPLLRRVPEDAQLVIFLPSLARVADGLNAFMKAIDLGDEGAVTARGLAENLGAGASALDLNGPLLFALSAQHAEPVVVARLTSATSQPTSRPTRTVAGVTVQEFEDGLLAVLDDSLALIARDEDSLKPALDTRGELGKTLMRELIERFPNEQALIYVDVAAWRERADVVLNTIAQTSMMGLAAAGPEAADAIYVQRWFFDQFRALIGESRSYTAGLTFTTAGIAYRDRIAVKPDGTLAKYLAAVRPTDRDLLRGLSAERPAAIVALEWSVPPEMRTIEEAMYEATLTTEERRERIGAERMKLGMERVKSAQRRLHGYNCAMEWNSKEHCMAIKGVYLTDDPNAYLAEFRAIHREVPELFELWANLPGGARVEHATATINDTSVEQYNFSIATGGSPVDAAVAAVYGPEPTMSVLPAQHGVGFYMGPRASSRDVLERMLKADPNTGLATDPRVKAAMSQLSPNPQLVMLFDTMRLVELSMQMSRAMGVPSVPLPHAAEPSDYAAYGLYLEAGGIRQQLHVPAGGVRSVIKSFKHIDGATSGGGD